MHKLSKRTGLQRRRNRAGYDGKKGWKSLSVCMRTLHPCKLKLRCRVGKCMEEVLIVQILIEFQAETTISSTSSGQTSTELIDWVMIYQGSSHFCLLFSIYPGKEAACCCSPTISLVENDAHMSHRFRMDETKIEAYHPRYPKYPGLQNLQPSSAWMQQHIWPKQ